MVLWYILKTAILFITDALLWNKFLSKLKACLGTFNYSVTMPRY